MGKNNYYIGDDFSYLIDDYDEYELIGLSKAVRTYVIDVTKMVGVFRKE